MIYINKAKSGRTGFFVLLFMLLSCCVVRYTLQINIPQALLLGIAVCIAMIGDRDELIAMSVCSIPLYTSFEYGYAVLICSVIYMLKYGRRLRFNQAVLPLFAIVLWETQHCFGESFEVVQYVARFIPLLLLLLLLSSGNEVFDYPFIVRSFAISTMAMCTSVLGKVLFAADFNILEAFAGMQRLGIQTQEVSSMMEVAGAEMNPNSLGVICVLAITGLFQVRDAGSKKRYDVVLMMVLLLFGAMTTSRTFLVCLALMGLLLLFSKKGGLARKLRFLGAILLLVLLAILLMNLIAPVTLQYFISRFTVKDITTGRMSLMTVYGKLMVTNLRILLYGLGAHNFGDKAMALCPQATNTPHNAIQELIIAWGIPGAVMLLAVFWVMIRCSRVQCRKQGLINYIPLIILLVKAQAGQLITSEYSMLLLSYTYLSLCANLTPEAVAAPAEPREVTGIDLWQVLTALWRKAVLIVLVAAMCAAAAFGITSSAVAPTYESSVMLYVNNQNVSVKDVVNSITDSDISVSRALVETYIVILNARQVLEEVIATAGSDRTVEELREMIAAAPVNKTEIFKVTVTSTDPKEATTLANAIAACLPARIAAIIDGTSAKVVDYAVIPSRPSSPSKMTNAFLAGILGLVVTVLLLLLREFRDTTIRSVEELTRQYRYPVLASVPDLFERADKSYYKSSYKSSYKE